MKKATQIKSNIWKQSRWMFLLVTAVGCATPEEFALWENAQTQTADTTLTSDQSLVPWISGIVSTTQIEVPDSKITPSKARCKYSIYVKGPINSDLKLVVDLSHPQKKTFNGGYGYLDDGGLRTYLFVFVTGDGAWDASTQTQEVDCTKGVITLKAGGLPGREPTLITRMGLNINMNENLDPNFNPGPFVAIHPDFSHQFQLISAESELVNASDYPKLHAHPGQSSCRYTLALQNAALLLSQRDEPHVALKLTHLLRLQDGTIVESGLKIANEATQIAERMVDGIQGGTVELYTYPTKKRQRCDSFRLEVGYKTAGSRVLESSRISEFHPRHSSFKQ